MWRGDRPGRASALAVLAVTLFAAAFSWFVYYGHFTEVYATAMARLTAEAPPAPTADGTLPGVPLRGDASEHPSLPIRIADALHLTAGSIGWPIATLAIGGACHAGGPRVLRSLDRAPLRMVRNVPAFSRRRRRA